MTHSGERIVLNPNGSQTLAGGKRSAATGLEIAGSRATPKGSKQSSRHGDARTARRPLRGRGNIVTRRPRMCCAIRG